MHKLFSALISSCGTTIDEKYSKLQPVVYEDTDDESDDEGGGDDSTSTDGSVDI